MSFDIYVAALPYDESAKFDRAIVVRAFEAIADDQASDYWLLQMPDGGETSVSLSIAQDAVISGFSVNRPPSHSAFPQFWDALFDVLSQTRTILLWPAGEGRPPYCVANPTLALGLPSDFLEDMGNPILVASGADIVAAITSSG